MGLRQRLWAKKKRRMWTEIFGGVCMHCGTSGHKRWNPLVFDIKDPTLGNGHAHHRQETSARMCYYHKQIALGNVQLLCKKCNDKKGNHIEDDDDDIEQPF